MVDGDLCPDHVLGQLPARWVALRCSTVVFLPGTPAVAAGHCLESSQPCPGLCAAATGRRGRVTHLTRRCPSPTHARGIASDFSCARICGPLSCRVANLYHVWPTYGRRQTQR